ncbi:hypothetical protein Acr_29g0001830 [Actinidia rufa]|uniref:Uncharacterized protein n=1 Tax=Actinidia rufa TaxID=165716 RepID=A0A7J0HDH4_9ERIC|nr:hypothetical protein Acr_29g0001830 [Actinidia rufa]
MKSRLRFADLAAISGEENLLLENVTRKMTPTVGGDGGGPSECDNQYHSDDTPVVALSTGWYNKGRRCLNDIIISANGRSVRAKVVDECDSTMGCDGDHDYQPPCNNNIVDASKAVWEALDVSPDNWGEMDITWSDA